MWWTRKRSKASKAADAEAAAEAAAEAQAEVEAEMPLSKHRNAFILMGIGGAALASFGIAAIAGIFGPVFFALVLTICVHPLAGVAREARRAARHRHRVGDHRRDAAAARVRVPRPRRVRAVRRAAAAVQGPDLRVRPGRRGVARLDRHQLRRDQRHRQGVRPGDAARVRRRTRRRPHGLGHAPRHPLHHAAAHGHGCRVRPDRAAGAVPGAAARRGLARELRQQRAPVHGRHHGARDRAGHRQLDRAGHPRRAGRVHLGTARVRLLLHPEHRLLHRDHPADHLRRAGRRAGRP